MADSRVLYSAQEDVFVLKFIGDIRFTLCGAIDNVIHRAFEKNYQSFVVDLTETTGIDSTALGVLAQIAVHTRKSNLPKPSLLIADAYMKHVLEGVCFHQVFNMLKQDDPKQQSFKEIHPVEISERDMVDKVLTAHKRLMSLS
jgi:anti-anti-sigma factor